MDAPVAELLHRYRRGIEVLDSALQGLSSGEADHRPAPDQWTIREIIAHVADSELVVANRLRLVIAEHEPVLTAYDQNAWTANLRYERRDPARSLELFRLLRTDNYELLNSLEEAAFGRIGHHQEAGPQTLRQLVEVYADHAEKHAAQVLKRRNEYRRHE